MPSSLSVRRFTDSLASMAFTVKCFPTSRMNSMAPSLVSQSALLIRRAGFVGLSKSSNRASCARMPAAFSSTRSLVRERTLRGLAARIANQPGASSHERDRRVTAALQVREADDLEQVSHVKARRGRIEADVGGDLVTREQLAGAFRGLINQPAPRQLVNEVHEPLLYRRVHLRSPDLASGAEQAVD